MKLSSVAVALQPLGLTVTPVPPMSSGIPTPARLPAQELALVVPAEAVRSHTHAQLQQEEGWSERKEHWITTRD